MPFYDDVGEKAPVKMKADELAKEYVRLLIKYGDDNFTKKLLSELIKQQKQTLRKIHPIHDEQKKRKKRLKYGVFEHPVPVNYSHKKLFEFIKKKDFEKACKYIDFMKKIPQIFLTKEEDDLVNKISKDGMPKGWRWEKDDPFIRYVMAQIDETIYK